MACSDVDRPGRGVTAQWLLVEGRRTCSRETDVLIAIVECAGAVVTLRLCFADSSTPGRAARTPTAVPRTCRRAAHGHTRHACTPRPQRLRKLKLAIRTVSYREAPAPMRLGRAPNSVHGHIQARPS